MFLWDNRLLFAVVTALLALVSAGCGSSNSSHNLSQAQAQAVSQELTQAVEQALGNTFSAPAESSSHSHVAEALNGIRPESASSCLGGSTINCTVNTSATCPQGGAVSVTGAITGTLSNGTGSVDATLAVTPDGCMVDGLTLNGAPNVAFSTDFNVTSDNLDFPVTATSNGGISYGPNPSGTCTVNVTFKVNSLSSCSVTGNVCGQSVNGSC
jgi:hypothetical protein